MSDNEENLDNDDSNLIKILIATDNHLGYDEKDHIRGNDSYITFEEILQHAVKNSVDFILLGGDLFHHANPTTNALNKCLHLLRKHTYGDDPILIEILSDQSINFHNSVNKSVNYADPNINIAIPVFSIHGNHDDPSGFARLSSLDVLSTCGLVNYFGKWVDLTKIDLHPIMIKKGETKLNIYGLSYIQDARLYRLFADSKVSMHRPENDPDSWFNLMVVHQNRADRGPKNYLPEKILPDFLDAVIWGHEHDCRIIPEQNDQKNFFVIQPGSSVATSFSEGEAIEKHCGLLLINRKQFKLVPIKLNTVRPFVFDSINLSEYANEINEGPEDISQNVQTLITRTIDNMILRAKDQLTGHPDQPTLPLIRLRILYESESQMFNAIRFGQKYNDMVANSKDMLLLKRNRTRVKQDPADFDKAAFNSVYKNEVEENEEVRVEDIIHRYFEKVDSSKKLRVFSNDSLSELCRRIVINDDEDAAQKIVNFYKVKLFDHLNEKLPDEEGIVDEIINFKTSKADDLYKPMMEMLDKRGENKTTTNFFNESTSENINPPTKQKTTRQTKASTSSAIDDDVQYIKPASTTRGRGKARGAARGRAKAELNVSISKKPTATSNQQSIQNSFSQTLRKPKAKIQYVPDSDESDSD